MCLQCVVDAQLVCRNITKGFHLYISTIEDDEWPKGWYGLIHKNSPTLVVGPEDEVVIFFGFDWLRRLLNQIYEAGYEHRRYDLFDWLTERAEFYKLFEGVINNAKDTE